MAGLSDFHGIFFCNGSVKKNPSIYDKEKYFICFEVHSPECITASYLNLKVKSITMEISFYCMMGGTTQLQNMNSRGILIFTTVKQVLFFFRN